MTLGSLVNWSREHNYTEHHFKIIKFNHTFEKDVIFLTREEVLQLYNFNDFNFEKKNHSKYTSEYITDTLKGGKTITYTNFEVYCDMIVFGCGVGCRYREIAFNILRFFPYICRSKQQLIF